MCVCVCACVCVLGRLSLIIGDSTDTVPAFTRAHPDFRCDILLVDGGHTLGIARADLLNMRMLARGRGRGGSGQQGHILLVDDTELGWEGLSDEAVLKDISELFQVGIT